MVRWGPRGRLARKVRRELRERQDLRGLRVRKALWDQWVRWERLDLQVQLVRQGRRESRVLFVAADDAEAISDSGHLRRCAPRVVLPM